ncbi:MAG: glutamate 5-kinase [Armatimonadota bacterium]
MAQRRQHLADAKRVTVKLGTRVVLDDAGDIDEARLAELVRETAELKAGGRDVLIVTSGAVGCGLGLLGMPRRVDDVSKRQAAAAVGQSALMRAYDRLFSQHGQHVAQVLLTPGDIADRERYLHIRNTIIALLEAGAVPIINENDTVSVAGVTFGENDKLAALVAGATGADVLIFLSPQDALYTADPATDPSAERIPEVEPGDADVMAVAGESGDDATRGGMLAKFQAARTAVAVGIAAVIAGGDEPRVLHRILEGEDIGTFFVPAATVSSRKSWIASALTPGGRIIVDEGAKAALLHADGASLLPSGVLDAVGSFRAGDLVVIVDAAGDEIGRGLVNYSAEEADRIKGVQSHQIKAILGHSAHDEVVHRDNLVISAPRD